MKRLIRKILREEIEKSDRHYRILDKISDYVEIPYFKSMEGLTIYDKDDQEYIMKKILGNISIKHKRVSKEKTIGNIRSNIYDDRGKMIYREDSDGEWEKWEFDDNSDNWTYREESDGWWYKREYDGKGNEIYVEYSNGEWGKREYDDNGNLIYWETSDGSWEKREYDDGGNMLYQENSYGVINDNR